MATEPLENESMLGVLIVLFLVVVSTIYVFSQQQQQRLPAAAHGARHGGPPGFADGALAAQQAANAIVTANLTDQQMRLHRSLPLRHGARAITVCVDALVQNKTDAGAIAWSSDDAPRVLADLLQVADVFVLCKLESDDLSVRAHIQRLLTATEDGTPSKKTRSLQPHKILFCKTSVGKIAFVRQIEPQVHVELDPSVVRELEKHVPRIVHVVPTLDATPAPGMHHVTDSFSTYFDLLSTI